MRRRMDVQMTLHRRIAVLMADRGWSQIELAHEMGMSANAFGERYRGNRDFRVHEIVRLAALFDIPVSTMFDGLESTNEYRKANIRGKELKEQEGFTDDDF